MKGLLAALALALPTSGRAEDTLERLKHVERCASLKPAPGENCSDIRAALAKIPHHRQGQAFYLNAEWEARAELKKLGIEAPPSAVVMDFASARGTWGEVVVVVDWSYHADDSRAKNQADYLAFTASLLQSDDYFDGGSFNHLWIYARENEKQPFKLAADADVTGVWYGAQLRDRCPELKRVAPGTAAVCFQHTLAGGFPEVRYQTDERASTGVVEEVLAYKDGKYVKKSRKD